MNSAAVLSAARAAYGLALLMAPAELLTAAGGPPPSGPECRVARLLGARQLAQAAFTATGGRRALRWGAAADGLHCVSMLMLAAAGRPRRRSELAESGIAALLAAASLRFCPSGGK